MSSTFSKNLKIGALIIVGVFLCGMAWGVYVPRSLSGKPVTVYQVQKGQGFTAIGVALEKQGVITSHGFFTFYALLSGNYHKLQAGSYDISPSMSVAQIIKKMATGDVIKNNVTVIEGWDLQDIGNYLASKKMMSLPDFITAASKDVSANYDFLKDKPKKLSVEGYVFPDTYQVPLGQTPDAFLATALDNFGKKLTPDLQKEITHQHKTLFQIITMASIVEKEVQTPADKKVVAGILWKRIANGMPLQVDSTINYITGKSDAGASVKDTQINSPYNTYKYPGLPLGPISNPGMDSIMAAIYPTKSDYWYYLSDPKTAQTIFSKTLQDQSNAIAKYLK